MCYAHEFQEEANTGEDEVLEISVAQPFPDDTWTVLAKL
jgi:hypothetical protein